MEVQFYLMDLIAQFAAPTSHCVGSWERVWAELQDQCQNKTETCRGGKWGQRTARKSTCTLCHKNQAGLISGTASEVTPQVCSDSSASPKWEQGMKLLSTEKHLLPSAALTISILLGLLSRIHKVTQRACAALNCSIWLIQEFQNCFKKGICLK